MKITERFTRYTNEQKLKGEVALANWIVYPIVEFIIEPHSLVKVVITLYSPVAQRELREQMYKAAVIDSLVVKITEDDFTFRVGALRFEEKLATGNTVNQEIHGYMMELDNEVSPPSPS